MGIISVCYYDHYYYYYKCVWNSIKCSTASLLTKQRLDLQRSRVIHHLMGQLQNHRTSLLLPTDFKELEAQCVSTQEIQVGKFTFP